MDFSALKTMILHQLCQYYLSVDDLIVLVMPSASALIAAVELSVEIFVYCE